MKRLIITPDWNESQKLLVLEVEGVARVTKTIAAGLTKDKAILVVNGIKEVDKQVEEVIMLYFQPMTITRLKEPK